MKVGVLGCPDVMRYSLTSDAIFETGISIEAIASRNRERALKVQEQYGIPKIFSSYYDLINSDCVDAIYVALPPALQYNWIIESLEKQKHVLAEKPICMFRKQVEYIYRLAQKHNLYVAEGLMIKYHPLQCYIHEIIKNGTYGKLNLIETSICMNIPEKKYNGFRSKEYLGGGVLWDEAPYWLQFLQATVGLDCFDFTVDNLQKDMVPINVVLSGKSNSIAYTVKMAYNEKYSADCTYYFDNAKLYIKNFFRSSLGKFKQSCEIETEVESIKTVFESQNYYQNEWKHFVTMSEMSKKNIFLCSDIQSQRDETIERIELLEKISNSIDSIMGGI